METLSNSARLSSNCPLGCEFWWICRLEARTARISDHSVIVFHQVFLLRHRSVWQHLATTFFGQEVPLQQGQLFEQTRYWRPVEPPLTIRQDWIPTSCNFGWKICASQEKKTMLPTPAGAHQRNDGEYFGPTFGSSRSWRQSPGATSWKFARQKPQHCRPHH